MIKTSFFGLGKPRISHLLLPSTLPQADRIAAPGRLTLYHRRVKEFRTPSLLRPGDPVKTGQRLALYADETAYVVSPVSGRIAAMSPQPGDYGAAYTAIAVDVDGPDESDDQFAALAQTPSLETAVNFLSWVPGQPPLALLADPDKQIRTLVVYGTDDDLMVATNQYILRSNLHAVTRGIKILKQLTGIEDIVLTTVGESIQGYGHIGAVVHRVDTAYPAALHPMIMHRILHQTLPAGKSPEDLGVCFISAEAVASLGEAFDSGRIPGLKTLTLITKAGLQRIVQVSLGVPVGEVLAHYDIRHNDEDRLIFGGPMRGAAIYSLEHPIMPDTNAVMVLDRADAAAVTDYPCVNCGDCIRACPADIPINMLVRFLEAGHYEEAADQYDLYSCIECGLCSYVCISKIPIFQYIKLAKYELERAKAAEAANA